MIRTSSTRRTIPVALAIAGLLDLAAPCGVAPAAEPIVLREGLGLARGGPGRAGRTLLASDPVTARVVAGDRVRPEAGDVVTAPDGSTRKWEPVAADAEGAFSGPAFRGGHAHFRVDLEAPRVLVLEASGHTSVRVNGVPRTGDPYGYGYVRLPVALNAGANDLLFQTGRGRLTARLVEPAAPAFLDPADSTLPDLVVGEPVDSPGAVVLINASAEPLRAARIEARLGDAPAVSTDLPALPPLSTRKVGFRIGGPAPDAPGDRTLTLTLVRDGQPSTPVELKLAAIAAGSVHKRTFLSGIDGSVQYYAWVPAGEPDRRPEFSRSAETGLFVPAAPSATAAKPGLILTLHGASVEAIGQARCYAPRGWAHVVAPTNRRPYGFDWEDWGRLDALEVLDLNLDRLDTDQSRTYLTGHSMGGHGTWHLGVTFPGRFAAIAPSAGWVSMFSYAGLRRDDRDDPVAALLRRGSNPSDTLGLARNLEKLGVYVLHGDRDDNVPVGQARTMRTELAGFHPDFTYYERPGAGHWWGNECVDWPPLMEFLARHVRPEPGSIRSVAFRTFSPGISSRLDWAEVEAQLRPLALSTIALERSEDGRRLTGTTENVARLTLDLTAWPAAESLDLALDGQDLKGVARPADGILRLGRDRASLTWAVAEAAPPGHKGPRRMGPFKDGFRHRVQLVYATGGTAEENAWALARARFDAETFWYRGNASVDVLPDTAFDPAAEPDRSVVLYGDARSHSDWAALLPDSPVEVRPGSIRLGERSWDGDDRACLFIRPRPGSAVATVAVVSGTGPAGRRLTETLPYFTSGVAYPDLTVVAASEGTPTVRVAGFFGNDWTVDTGEFAGPDLPAPATQP